MKKFPKKTGKKSQLQMGESTAVVIVVIVLIFLGLVVYYGFWSSGRQGEISAQKDVKAVELGLAVSYMPEMHCTFLGSSSTNCFDSLKLEVLSEKKNDREWQLYYFGRLGYARIEVIQVYPSHKSFLVYERKQDDEQSQLPVFIPANIHDPITDTYGFGYLNVTKYS